MTEIRNYFSSFFNFNKILPVLVPQPGEVELLPDQSVSSKYPLEAQQFWCERFLLRFCKGKRKSNFSTFDTTFEVND